MSTTTPLFIDDRAGSKDLMKHLTIPAELCRLEFGDALIIGNGPDEAVTTVGVEVKSITDMLQSVDTGRLAAHQLPGLLATYDVPWLLIYGPYRPGPEKQLQVLTRKGWRSFKLGVRPVPYGYLESFIFDVAATGCRVKHVHCEEDAAAWLEVLHRWWTKRWSEHKGLRQFDNSKNLSLLPGMTVEQFQIAKVAAQLPGIGFERACAVANSFASIGAMLSATEADWQRIDGIGKVIAQTVVRVIRG